jgi:hypothetical protein
MKFECPNRVARVTCPGRTGSPKVMGRVGTTECEMTIDSGALITMVRADLVRKEDFTGEVVPLKSVCGKAFPAQVARVWLHFGKYTAKREVAVSEHLSEAVLLGMDLGLLDYLLKLEKQQWKQGPAINIVTRAEAKRQVEQARQDEELDARDKAQPVPLLHENEKLDSTSGVASAEGGQKEACLDTEDPVQVVAMPAEGDAAHVIGDKVHDDADELNSTVQDNGKVHVHTHVGTADEVQLVNVEQGEQKAGAYNGWRMPDFQAPTYTAATV